MSRASRLDELLFRRGELPLGEVASDPRLLLRRLLLAEILAAPPGLRRPGEATPLTALGDAGFERS